MSLSADDRLLGEKAHYYCSSSEDEENDDEHVKTTSSTVVSNTDNITNHNLDVDHAVKDFTSNTGPKGVIEDWRKYKQLETERREDQENERVAILKKLSLTCRTHKEDEIEKEKDAALTKQLNEKFDELEVEFLNEYRQKRLDEMKKVIQTIEALVYAVRSGSCFPPSV